MKLPFHFQFILAPLLIVGLLACLVSYTLIELSNIHRENELTVRWELLTNRIHSSIANASLLDRSVRELIDQPLAQQDDERLFSYLEQTTVLADSLVLLEDIPADLQREIDVAEALLREPERVDPTAIHDALTTLLPALQYQHKVFMAHRRSAFIGYHRGLSAIIPRLSGALLSVLAICIALAAGHAFWGLHATGTRL